MQYNMDENNYRFYHCYQRFNSIGCHPVNNYNTPPLEQNFRLLFVPKYLPELLDTMVLNQYRYIDVMKKLNYKPIKIIKMSKL